MTSLKQYSLYREDEKDTPVLNPLCDAKLVDTDASVDL